jgi:hypothetical protein
MYEVTLSVEVMPYNAVYSHFRGMCHLHLQGNILLLCPLDGGNIFLQNTGTHLPDYMESLIFTHHFENLKSQTNVCYTSKTRIRMYLNWYTHLQPTSCYTDLSCHFQEHCFVTNHITLVIFNINTSPNFKDF